MRSCAIAVVCLSLSFAAVVAAQEPAGPVIEIQGRGLSAEIDKLVAIWLYPEDYEGRTIRLRGFQFEPDEFEYFPDENGYLFSCESAVQGRNDGFHPHIGNATFLSREKLNFFCSTSDGQRIRRLFKHNQCAYAITADVELRVERRNYIYLGVVTSFQPTSVKEEQEAGGLEQQVR